MPIQYVLGASGSGKSHYLYEYVINESVKNPDKNYFIVVPEQFTMSTQQKIINMHPRHGIMNVDILSFPRMAYRVFAEVGVKQNKLLDDTGKSLVLRKVIENNKSDLKYFARNVGKAGFVEEIKSVISEFLQYSVSVGNISDLKKKITENHILRYKLDDIEILYRGFNEYIKDRFIASEELLEVLCTVIDRSSLIRNSIIVFDGFTGFTPIQYRLIGILMELCSEIKVALSIDSAERVNVIDGIENLFYLSKNTIARLNSIADQTGTQVSRPEIMEDIISYRLRNSTPLAFMEKNIFRNNGAVFEGNLDRKINIYEGTNPKNEIDYVVGEIKRIIASEKYHYSDIAVVSADIEKYGHMAGSIMEQNDIPCFVDYKRNLMGNVIVEFIRSALEVIESDFSYESVFRLLKTGIMDFAGDDINQLENYVLALGIRGFSSWDRKWIRMYSGRAEKTITIEKIDEIRCRFVELMGTLRNKMKESKTVRDYVTVLYEFADMMELERKAAEYAAGFDAVHDISLAGEYRQCYGKIIELMDKMVSLMGDEEVSFREFNDILDSGFEEIKVGLIPQKKDSVIIGDIERTRIDNIRVLFFLGVNDGNIPKNGDKGGLLSSVDRETMAENDIVLSPDERQNAFTQRFYLYLALTKASDRLYLSYSDMDTDGKSLRVSYLIGVIKNMFPMLRVQNEKSSKKILGTVKIPKALFTWNGVVYNGITPANASLIYGDDISKSASRIELFYSCAFAHFAAYGLRLEDRKIYEIDSADIGTLFHDTLERVSQKIVENGKGFTEITLEERKKIVEESVLEAATDYNNSVLFDSERNRYFVKRLMSMTDTTVWAIGEQLKHGLFMPRHFEKSFCTKENIVGRIDRIDTYEDDENVYVKVVDYKTGNSDFDLNEAYYGLKIQLITYMQAAEQIERKLHPDKEIVTAGLFYYNIKTPFASDDASQEIIDHELLEELRMKGLVNDNPVVLNILERDRQGASVAIPASFNKDGGVKKSSSVIGNENFRLLSDHTRRIINDAAHKMEDGFTDINPYRRDGRTACDYCAYSSVCGFDAKITGYSFNNIKELDEDEIWKKMGGKDGE